MNVRIICYFSAFVELVNMYKYGISSLLTINLEIIVETIYNIGVDTG